MLLFKNYDAKQKHCTSNISPTASDQHQNSACSPSPALEQCMFTVSIIRTVHVHRLQHQNSACSPSPALEQCKFTASSIITVHVHRLQHQNSACSPSPALEQCMFTILNKIRKELKKYLLHFICKLYNLKRFMLILTKKIKQNF